MNSLCETRALRAALFGITLEFVKNTARRRKPIAAEQIARRAEPRNPRHSFAFAYIRGAPHGKPGQAGQAGFARSL